jgi:hypothetical protein
MGKMMGRYVRRIGRRWHIVLALTGLLLLTAVPAFSQGCALCYTQAASSGSKVIAALRSGILVLIVPPTLGSIGMIFVVHRKRNQVRRTEFSDEPGSDWGQD